MLRKDSNGNCQNVPAGKTPERKVYATGWAAARAMARCEANMASDKRVAAATGGT